MYIRFEENYFSIASKIERLLASAREVENVNQAPAAQIPSPEGYVRDISQVHLPKIAIPKFSGNYED